MYDPLQIIQEYENSSANPNLGTGGTDLSSVISSGNVDQYGFPIWPGVSGPAGNSTAAGLYQITQSTWDQYAPQVGVNDFSPASQAAVAAAIYNTNGFGAWAPYNSNLQNAINDLGGATEFPTPGSYDYQNATDYAQLPNTGQLTGATTASVDSGTGSFLTSPGYYDQNGNFVPTPATPGSPVTGGSPTAGTTALTSASSTNWWQSFIADAGNVMMRGGIILLAVALIAVAAAMAMSGENVTQTVKRGLSRVARVAA